MALTNEPAPVPPLMQLSAVVGLADVLQQTPRALTAPPPAEVTFPPPEAVVGVIPVIAAVVTTGSSSMDTLLPRTHRLYKAALLELESVPPLLKLTCHALPGVVAEDVDDQ
jgi:hypothetical protein